jgi:tetratricopeptide (TPR) repeat protein
VEADLWDAEESGRPSSVPPVLRGSAQPPGGPPDLELEQPASSAGRSRDKAGGASFGEVDLPMEGGHGSIGLEDARPAASEPAPEPPAADDDDMEFGAIPQSESTGSVQLAASPVAARVPSIRPAPPQKVSTGGRIAAGVVALLVLVGASLEIWTPFGAFGRHAIMDIVNADRYAALQTQTIQQARSLLANDTFHDASEALALVDAAAAKAPRFRQLLAYGAFVGYVAELRYGRGPNIDAHAKQQLAQLAAEKITPGIELARTAEAAAGSELSRARQLVEGLAERQRQDPDVALLAGEIELLTKEPDKALASFKQAEQLGGATARTAFGAARALVAKGDASGGVVQARKVLELAPRHAGARVLIGRTLWSANDEEGASKILSAVAQAGPVHEAASPAELVEALTVMSRIHIARSRMTQAEAALAEALKIDPKSGSALAGMGEVLYREGRFTDALARFESGIQADPDGMLAKIGAAKTKIALERLAEAKEQLKKLRDARPTDFEAAYWLGRAEESLGDKKSAEKTYTDAIKVGAGKPETIDAYVALSQVLSSQGRAAEAEAALAEAKQKLPELPSLHRALGEAHLAAGRYDAAQAEFAQTLKLDGDDPAARFKLGVTLRRMGKFDEAVAEFDKVAALDKEYPGLALERGLLHEASNRTSEALAYYQQALSKAPDDPDLMLRVGSAEVSSGRAVQAEEILRKVIAKRPNSAEVNHYLGRALLLKGTNLAEALRFLGRAAEIDPHRAEYHLYMGWAANDAGQPAVAREQLEKALELDQGLADAYWQRGVLQRKQGAVIDAVKNLQTALQLRPSRYEAYATLAECYEDQNKAGEAIASWRKALASGTGQPEWHYRLGKLLGRAGESELRQAVTLAVPLDVKPGWLTQAYFDLAELERSGGRSKDAIDHYRRFLGQANPDSPYRQDAIKALAALGSPYEGQ